MDELIKILSKMSDDIQELKTWKSEMSKHFKQEQDEQQPLDTVAEFNRFITEKRAQIAREQQELSKLHSMLV